MIFQFFPIKSPLSKVSLKLQQAMLHCLNIPSQKNDTCALQNHAKCMQWNYVLFQD